MAPLSVPRLYGLADAEALGARTVSEAVAAWAAAGVRWIQMRGKSLPDDELLRQADQSAAAAAGTRTRLWMNDRPDLARLAGCFGVHLGQGDLPPAAARRFLGDGIRIGRSTHDREQIAAAAGDPAVDVIAVGPVFATASKAAAEPAVGLELLRWARERTSKPLIAIGGIEAANAAGVLATGVDGVAVLGALCHGDLRANAERLLAAVEGG